VPLFDGRSKSVILFPSISIILQSM